MEYMHRPFFFCVCTSVCVWVRARVHFNESLRKHSDTQFKNKYAELKVNRKYANMSTAFKYGS